MTAAFVLVYKEIERIYSALELSSYRSRLDVMRASEF
jgi:hypothetical protein